MSDDRVCRMCGEGFESERAEHQRKHRCDCENCVDGAYS